MKFLIPIFLLATFVSCSSNPYKLTKNGLKVKVYVNKPKKCEVIGRVSGASNEGTREGAINIARNEAAEKGADALYLNDEVQNGAVIKVKGTAYKCK